jgi:hypothetical protein
MILNRNCQPSARVSRNDLSDEGGSTHIRGMLITSPGVIAVAPCNPQLLRYESQSRAQVVMRNPFCNAAMPVPSSFLSVVLSRN